MNLWAFRFLLWYIAILFVQPQNRFLFLYPYRIANLSILIAMGLHVMSALQENRPLIRFGPGTITALILMISGMISLHFGALQSSSAWNGYIDMLMKNALALILVEATAWSIERVWAVQATMLLSTLWWVKAGLRLSASGATYAGDRIMGAAVGMVENPNGFAYMMCLFLPLYLYFYQKAKWKKLRIFFLLVALASVYIIFQTGSRTGLVSLIVLAFFLFPKYGGQHKASLVVGAVAIFFIFSIVDEGNIRRFKSIPDSMMSFLRGEEAKPTEMLTQDEQSAQERRMKNVDTWALIKEYPLFGVGINPDQSKYADKHPFATGQVHNEILMAGRQMGFLGMGIYLALLFILYWYGRQIQLLANTSWPALADMGWTFKMQTIVFVVGGYFSPLPWNPPMMILVGSASALWLNVNSPAETENVFA